MPGYAATRADWRSSEAWLRDRDGRLLDMVRIDHSLRKLDWTPIDRIAPALRDAVIAGEDKRFAAHNGVDWIGLAGSGWAALRGQHARGASTITMQLAAFLTPELGAPGMRGLRGKLRQMRAARAIEAHWSKDQIIEAYLNLASFRGEAQGVAAATNALFDKAPAMVDRDEALLLAALLPSPQASAHAIAQRACRLGHVMNATRNTITSSQRKLGSQEDTSAPNTHETPASAGVTTESGLDCTMLLAEAEGMTSTAQRTADDPSLAPHLAQRLLRDPGQTVTTTLDARIQTIAATALRHQLVGLGGERARDGAVVVVDNKTGDVLAYVGGIGGASTASHVDNVAAPRQAGSTLKPFLYGHAIERGYLTAASVLDDSPVELDTASGLYVPKDYDHDYKGPVSVRTALASSLNVPAVRALLIDGVDDFRDRLWDVGYRSLVEDGAYYGFSLALGSAEVTLLQQAAAYRALADGGRYVPLRLSQTDPRTSPRQVMTPAAAWIVGDILADADARAVTFGLDSALRLPFWAAAKTGTSKAMRDNWCVGFSDRFTVAVWIGNAEGDSMTRVSGTSGAAPVWREVMLALHRDTPGRAPSPPPEVTRHPVRFVGTAEPTRAEYFLAGTGQALLAQAPPAARRPRIVSPVSGSVYALDPDIPPARQRIRLAAIGITGGERWRLDTRDFGATEMKAAMMPPPGKHRLALIGQDGRAVDEIVFTVR
jgi:penicillin-binding protein 1C